MPLGPRHIFSILAAVAALLIAAHSAAAMEFDCDPLIRRAQSTGEAPTIKIDAQEGYVTMRTSFGSCRESIGKRDFDQVGKTDKAVRAQGCKQRIAQVWEGDYHVIGDTRYWLEQVFTVDTDRDGVTDNIGFTLVTMKDDRAVRALAYYFSDDALQASTVPGLALPKGMTVGDICFGENGFAPPVMESKPQAFTAFDVPDLQRQLESNADARNRGGLRAASNSKESALDLPIWIWALGGSTAAVGGSFLVYRNHRRKVIERKLFGNDDDGDDDRDA